MTFTIPSCALQFHPSTINDFIKSINELVRVGFEAYAEGYQIAYQKDQEITITKGQKVGGLIGSGAGAVAGSAVGWFASVRITSLLQNVASDLVSHPLMKIAIKTACYAIGPHLCAPGQRVGTAGRRSCCDSFMQWLWP